MKSKNAGSLIGGIISAFVAMFCGICGLVFKLIGTVFVNNPEEVHVTVNGRVLEGKEAAEAALKLGGILSTVGGVMLIIASVFLLIFLILLIVYFVRKERA